LSLLPDSANTVLSDMLVSHHHNEFYANLSKVFKTFAPSDCLASHSWRQKGPVTHTLLWKLRCGHQQFELPVVNFVTVLQQY